MGKPTFMFCLLSFIILGRPAQAGINTYSIQEALAKNLITAALKSNPDASSDHYGPCITITIQNRTAQRLSINLENGRRLDCTSDSIQDMIVTRNEIFALLPSARQEFTIYAMCAEKQNNSPEEHSVFRIGAMSSSVIVQLTTLIENLQAQNFTGQQALWVLTNDDCPEHIRGDSSVVQALRRYLHNAIAGLRKFEQEKGFIYDYSFPKENDGTFTIEGDLGWEMPYTNYVSLIVYDNNGKEVLKIFQDVVYAGGYQHYRYKATSPAFRSGGLYWVKARTKDKILKEVAILMD